MAETFYKYDHDYNGLSKDTVYNGSGKAFENWDSLLAANNGQAPTIQTRAIPTVPVNVNASPSTTSNTFTQEPKTQYDLQSALQRNQQLQQQLLSAYQTPDPAMQQAGQQYNQLQNQADQNQLARAQVQMGAYNSIQDVKEKPIAMPFITGQAKSISDRADLKLGMLGVEAQGIGVQMNAASRNLQTLAANREQTLKAYELAASFGREDVNLAFQLKQIQQQEEKAAMQFAVENQISKPYFAVGNTVYPTGGGGGFTSPEDFQQRTGMSLQQAEAQGLIQRDFGQPESSGVSWGKIGETVDEFGNKTDIMGWIDKNNQTVTPVSGPTGASGVPAAAWEQQYATGSQGGQCGVFAHKLVEFPNVGNMLAEKQASVNKHGVKADQWRKEGPQVGDVLIFNQGKYGHVAVVNEVLPNGQLKLSESNYNLDEKVNHSRVISANDKNIYGAIRGTLKGQAAPQPKAQAIKLSDDEKRRLAGAGFNSEEIRQIQLDVGQYGLDPVIAGIQDPNQRTTLSNVLKGVTESQAQAEEEKKKQSFLSPEWFWQNYPREDLAKMAKADGLTKRKSDGSISAFLGGTEGDPDAYIAQMMDKINKMRQRGMSDEEIYKELFGT